MALAASGSASAVDEQRSEEQPIPASPPRGVKRLPTIEEVRVHIIQFKLYDLDTI